MRGLLGFFYQKQFHDFFQTFGNVEGLADRFLMNGAGAERDQCVPGRRLPEQHGPHRHRPGRVRRRSSFDITDTARDVGRRALFRAGDDGQGILRVRPWVQSGRRSRHRCRATAMMTLSRLEPGDPRTAAWELLARWPGWSRNGEWRCPSQEDREDAPCQNVDKRIEESDYVGRVNLSCKATETRRCCMRPGRRATGRAASSAIRSPGFRVRTS